MLKRAVAEDTVDWAGVAVDIGELTKAVCWNVVFGNGESVVVKPELGHC